MKDPVIEPPADLIEALNLMKRMVCVGHVTPDADCLGSLLALARAWSQGGSRDASVSLPEGSVSQRLAFMVEAGGIRLASLEDFTAADGFFVVDTAKESRCNTPAGVGDAWSAGRTVVNVDHHVTNTRFGQVNWIVDTAPSSSELVFRIIRSAGKDIDATTASLLYSGIYTDTVGFSLPATSGLTLRTAAELAECGASVGQLGARLSRSHRPGDFRLRGTIYQNTQLVGDNQLAYSTASYDEIVAAGCGAADIDDQVSIPRSLGGIRMAILFTEANQGITRLNIRGEQGTKVVEFARSFEGGGHAEAAGAMLECGIEEAVARVIPAALEAIRKQDGHSGKPQ